MKVGNVAIGGTKSVRHVLQVSMVIYSPSKVLVCLGIFGGSFPPSRPSFRHSLQVPKLPIRLGCRILSTGQGIRVSDFVHVSWSLELRQLRTLFLHRFLLGVEVVGSGRGFRSVCEVLTRRCGILGVGIGGRQVVPIGKHGRI